MARPRTAPQTEAPDERVEVRAEAKWVRLSPRKARLVAQHIRGRTVPEARTMLAFTQRAAAREIEKVLRSAVANAEANHNLIGDNLLVSSAYVDEGPVIKRWRARARGRAARIRKPTCHITVKLAPVGDGVPAEPPRRQRQTTEQPPPEPAAEAKPKRAPRAKKDEEASESKPKRPSRPRKTKEETDN